MKAENVKRRQKELSKRQAIYVAQRERGTSRQESAILAGYANVDKAGEQVESSPVVQAELEKARQELVATTGKSREDIAGMMLEAYEVAKLMSDPGTMVRAASELGKLLGHFAPEVKKHEYGFDKETKEALARMSDSELIKIARGRTVEGEVQVVNDSE